MDLLLQSEKNASCDLSGQYVKARSSRLGEWVQQGMLLRRTCCNRFVNVMQPGPTPCATASIRRHRVLHCDNHVTCCCAPAVAAPLLATPPCQPCCCCCQGWLCTVHDICVHPVPKPFGEMKTQLSRSTTCSSTSSADACLRPQP
jgi:hypothetical protein